MYGLNLHFESPVDKKMFFEQNPTFWSPTYFMQKVLQNSMKVDNIMGRVQIIAVQNGGN